jgi:hypothetical protein
MKFIDAVTGKHSNKCFIPGKKYLFPYSDFLFHDYPVFIFNAIPDFVDSPKYNLDNDLIHALFNGSGWIEEYIKSVFQLSDYFLTDNN